MKRSAIRCVASDAIHYLWCDGATGNDFMLAIADLLESDTFQGGLQEDQQNDGYWLWYTIHEFFLARFGGRSSGLMGTYTLFEDSAYEPLLSIDSHGMCELVDTTGQILSGTYEFANMARMIRLVLSAEPGADLGVLYAWLDVDEEI